MLASGSDDHSARLWDLRKKKCAPRHPLPPPPAHATLHAPPTLPHALTRPRTPLTPLSPPPLPRRCAYTIPGHSALISHVKFQPEHGHYLMTASYDNKVKLWSMRDHSLIKVMEGHEGRVMCADASDDGKYFATSAMDRTWKLWGR